MASGWSTAYYSSGWMDAEDSRVEYDWAVLVLEKNLGSTMGYLNVTTDLPAMGYACGVYGYADELNKAESLHISTGTREVGTTNWFTYNATTYGGFSGGPIINSSGNIIGVHKGIQESTGNAMGTRITPDIANLIASLR